MRGPEVQVLVWAPNICQRNFSPYLTRRPNAVPPVVMIQSYRTGIGPRLNNFVCTVDIICDDTIVVLLDIISILRDNFLDCGSRAGINTWCVAYCSRSDVSTWVDDPKRTSNLGPGDFSGLDIPKRPASQDDKKKYRPWIHSSIRIQ